MNKNVVRMGVAAALVLLASCDRAPAETVRAPTQAEEIAEFCNQIASDFVGGGARNSNLFMGRIHHKIVEKEWDPETVVNACSEALQRKTEFIQQHAQTIERGTQ